MNQVSLINKNSLKSLKQLQSIGFCEKSMDFKTLISYYMDIKLRKVGVVLNGHKIEVSENEKDILKVVEKLCAQMEGDARFEDILLSFRKFGVSKETFLTVLDQLLIGDLNWSRVLSVIALSGELAVQCVERDEEHKIDLIQDCAIAFADVKLKDWIIRQGGLKTILSYSKQPERPVSNWETKLLAAGAIGVAVGLYVASKA